MFGVTKKRGCNEISKVSRPKIRRTKSKHTKLITDPQISVTNTRITMPYDFTEAVSSVTAYKRNPELNIKEYNVVTANATETVNEASENSQTLEDQTHFKSISDYFVKLQEHKPSRSSSIFKEINLRYQEVVSCQSQDTSSFCGSLSNLMELHAICKGRFTSSISKIKCLVNDVNNNTVQTGFEGAEACNYDINNQCSDITLVCPSDEWITKTPPNRPPPLPVIEPNLYIPCILTRNSSDFRNRPLEGCKRPISNLLQLNAQSPSTHIKRNRILQENCNVRDSRLSIFDIQQDSTANRSNCAAGFSYGNFESSEFVDDLSLKIEESLLMPNVPDLKDPSPLKFFPRKIFVSDL